MADLLYLCEICGMVLEEHHCKATCPNCGRMLDCSDLPAMPALGTIESEAGEDHFIPRTPPPHPPPTGRPSPGVNGVGRQP